MKGDGSCPGRSRKVWAIDSGESVCTHSSRSLRQSGFAMVVVGRWRRRNEMSSTLLLSFQTHELPPNTFLLLIISQPSACLPLTSLLLLDDSPTRLIFALLLAHLGALANCSRVSLASLDIAGPLFYRNIYRSGKTDHAIALRRAEPDSVDLASHWGIPSLLLVFRQQRHQSPFVTRYTSLE